MGRTLPSATQNVGDFTATRIASDCAVLASPTYLFYGRTFTIETTALCFSTWFLFTLARAVRDPDPAVRRVGVILTMYLGPADLLVTLDVHFAPGIPAESVDDISADGNHIGGCRDYRKLAGEIQQGH